MTKASATLALGLAFGIVGVMLYNRLRRIAVEEDAERLLNRICDQLLSLEVPLGVSGRLVTS